MRIIVAGELERFLLVARGDQRQLRVAFEGTHDVAHFAIHARGIADTAKNARQLSPKRKAFTMSAELFLMQHTCHWFCRSRAVASARIQVRHQTSHAMALASVSPATRNAYRALTGV